jgi:ubiquinone/menaquinone biosynthesis C-methylase UbiE
MSGAAPAACRSSCRARGSTSPGMDLDPAMIARARANAAGASREGHERTPSFLVGDVAAMSFADGTFDVVVSTLSMHHWNDTTAGLGDIARVLRPGGRALIWDFSRGRIPLHGSLPDPAAHAEGTALRVDRSDPWRWPWRIALLQRVELSQASS